MFAYILRVIAFAVSFLGLVIRAITIGYAPKDTSGRNSKDHVAGVLNTTGIYSIVRNPLYLGNFLIVLGVALIVKPFWLVVIYFFIFWIYYEQIIFSEEEFLLKKFGENYYKWTNKTPVIIPKFTGYKKNILSFSLLNVLGREYQSFFALIVVFFLLETIGTFQAENFFIINKVWIIILSASFAIFLILRILKKNTNFLNIENR